MPVKRKFAVLGLLAADLALPLLAARHPQVVERYYAQALYPVLSRTLSAVSDPLPFSLAELLLLLAAIMAFKLIYVWLCAFSKLPSSADIPRWIARCVFQALSIAVTIHFAFLLCWGLNYYRPPLAEQLGLKVQPSSSAELLALAQGLLLQANEERALLPENAQGVVRFEGEPRQYLHCLWQSGEGAAAVEYRRAKAVLLSPLMSYTMITGFFFPFTGEANLNMQVPLFELPATVAHELAHRDGIAREDEANYISWQNSRLTGVSLEVRYSGTLRALTYTLNAAYSAVSSEEYAALWREISAGVARDLAYSREFWERYRGPVQNISEQVNDVYLKSNRQTDGVQSYGRLVDLLLAERRLKGERNE